MTWILTYTGKRVDLANPDPDVVDLRDIAHALSNINRFTGHGIRGFSVAQHCVLVSRLCQDDRAKWALFHDAHEAYLGDVSAPLGQVLAQHDAGYLQGLKADWDTAIALKFGLMPCDVHREDKLAMIAEVAKNGPEGMPLSEWVVLNGLEPKQVERDWRGYVGAVLSPVEAELTFTSVAKGFGVK